MKTLLQELYYMKVLLPFLRDHNTTIHDPAAGEEAISHFLESISGDTFAKLFISP